MKEDNAQVKEQEPVKPAESQTKNAEAEGSRSRSRRQASVDAAQKITTHHQMEKVTLKQFNKFMIKKSK